jgi:hypothetical protein
VSWDEFQQERLKEVLKLQAALQRIRRARAAGEPVDQADLDLLEPEVSYKGGNLDRLWATENF